MHKSLTYIFLSTWPVLQLLTIYGSGERGIAVDARMPFVALLLCIALMMMLLEKRQIKIGPPFICFFILFLYMLSVSYLNGSEGSLAQISRDQFKISIMPLALYFIIENSGRYFNRKVLVFSIIISGIIIAGIGIAEFIAGHNLIGEFNTHTDNEAKYIQNIYRANGPFKEAIGYSAIVLLYIPFTYHYFKENIISKILFILIFIIFSAGFLATIARASIIAYLILLIVLFSLNNLKGNIINIYLALVLAMSIYLSWEIISDSVIFKKRIADPGNVIGRWNQLKECLDIFKINPLTGIGYGIYKKTHEYYIHNTYLKYLVELGFIGFISYLVFIISVVFSNFKKVFLKGSPHLLRVRLSLIIIVAIVPNTIDLLNNQYFTLALFVMIAVLNLPPEKECPVKIGESFGATGAH